MTTRSMTVDELMETLVDAFEILTPDNLDRLISFYDEAAQFKDPLNDVSGRAAIRRIFLQMFEKLDRPRFVVHEGMASGNQGFMTWEMHFRMPRLLHGAMSIRGVTHLRFSPAGRVLLHRDYWDSAEELYEKIPVLSHFMRWLRLHAAAG